MKKTFLSLLLLVMATTMNAQVGLKGDMNGDGKIDVADVTALVNVAIGRSEAELINPYVVDNSRVAGTWYAPDGSSFTFNADGTTNYPGGTTYQFMPFMGQLVVSSATDEVVKTMKITAVTAEYLQEESTINGAVTRYINSASIVSAITLNETTLSINCGETAQLTATVSPSNALNTEVAWTSSDENVATVSETGLVTAVAGGTCTITCTAQDGAGASATCEVTVIQLVTGISLSQSTLSLNSGSTSQLSATVLPSNANNMGIAWTSSDEDVATVDADGVVTAVSRGTCTIACTAQDGSEVSATCEVTVNQLVTGISLSQSTLSLNSGSTSQLSATALPSNANDNSVTWTTSDEDVATVDANGLVTAIAGGTCTITCTAKDGSGASASCEVSVVQLATGITLSHTKLCMQLDEDLTLTATVLPSNVNNDGVTWTSSDEDVAEVNRKGNVLANGVGTCIITCTAKDGSGVSATCEVTVLNQKVTSITLSSTSCWLNVDESHQLTATVLPSDADNPSLSWTSSNTAVATVDANGLVTAVAGGTCTITCTAQDGSGVKAICTVCVDNSGSIYGRDYVDLGLPSGTLWATCNIGAGNPEDYGLYFAWGETTWYTQDTSDGHSFDWTSYKYAVNSRNTLTKYCDRSDYGNNGFTDTLTELEPEDDAAYVNWGSEWRMPSGVQQDELRSNCTWTWTTKNGKNGCEVVGPNGNSIFLPAAGGRRSSSLYDAGSWGNYWSRTLYTGFYPELGYGLAFGSDQVSCGGIFRDIGYSVRPVRNVYVTSITLNQTSLSLYAGATSQLSATVSPSNAFNKNVTWSSNNTSVATVDANGVVTAVGPGSCDITCTAADGSGKVATCSVMVTQLVTSITLNKTSLYLYLSTGATYQLSATVSPSNASNMNVTWTSFDTSVATVDANGVVTAVAAGNCNITCTAQDGSGVSATCTVNVDLQNYVDLGLPSGTLWATCNIGATNPEDYGLYFAWGETTGYTQYSSDRHSFDWTSYKYAVNSDNTLTKYCNTDTLTELVLEDDAAYVNWGSDWRMPSSVQLDELRSNCTWTWTTKNGKNGYEVVGSNGNSIFLPAAGSRYYSSLGAAGSYGYYWSRTLNNIPNDANELYFYSDGVYWSGYFRYYGHSVRPVVSVNVTSITLNQTSLSLYTGATSQLTATVSPSKAFNKNVTWSSNNRAVAMVNANGVVTAVDSGSCTITCTAADGSGVTATCTVTVTGTTGHACVDLGLPSGTLWATCNIGADNPEDYGLYFAWGETTGYTQDTSDGHYFDWTPYKYAVNSDKTFTKYCNSSNYGNNGFTDTLTELVPEDDAAYVNWGSNWRMPSKEQQDELRSNCTWTWTTKNGKSGYEVVGTNGHSIFLPLAGERYYSSLNSAYGWYWSRTLDTSSEPRSVYCLLLRSSEVARQVYDRFHGLSVRPVRVSQ